MDRELLWSRWDASEVEKLKTLYPTLSSHEVAEVLSRPEGSIRVKAMKLGVKKKDVEIKLYKESAKLNKKGIKIASD